MSDDLDSRSVSLSRGIPAGKRLATRRVRSIVPDASTARLFAKWMIVNATGIEVSTARALDAISLKIMS